MAPLLLLFLSSFAFDVAPNPDLVLGKRVPDVALIDEWGREVTLRDVSSGKPVVLSMVYTRCTSACPLIVEGMKEALKRMGRKDFTPLLVDFDERDRPEDLRKFIRERRIGDGWRVTVAKGENLRKLTNVLDFKFYYDRGTDTFAHPNVLVVISPDLRVSGYMLGVRYDPDRLSSMIDKAWRGQVDLNWVKGLLLRCFRYDPATGTYTLDWSFVAMVIGGLIPLSGMFYFLFLKDLLPRIRRFA